VSLRLAPIERLRRLSAALREPPGLAIEERAWPTPTAAVAFAERRANCVGYASLFVGLARELEVPAYFVLVDDLPAARGAVAGSDTLAVTEGHLAAAWGAGDALRVFDLGGESDGRLLSVRPITDLAAIAVYYSNRGVESLLAGEHASAAAWLEVAAELEPVALPSTWVNLGVALRRSGDLEGAQRAYRRALELDPTAGASYRNLAALLVASGRQREAAALLAIASNLVGEDTLTALALARRSLLAGNLQEARGLYRRALELARAGRR
jgi:tetratricopeptide (TPR) repeat protein